MIILKNIQKSKERLTEVTNSSKILFEKKKIRKEILAKLKSQTKKEILEKSLVIKERLFELEEFKKARCVVVYVSMKGEVDTHQIIDEGIRMGKRVGVPVVVSAVGGSANLCGGKGKKDLIISQITDRIRQLEIGPYGIRQPKRNEIKSIPYKDMDLVLVPAVAYDRDGNRLGRGKGFYDRFLKRLPKKTTKTIGLCFDFQVVKSIPTLPHDIPVRMVLTDTD